MKKITLLIILFSLQIFSQENSSQKILTLQNDLKTSFKKENQKTSINILQEKDLKKNTGLAILYSLLLPGMGELYAGSYSSGKYFTIAEGALWLTYFGMNTYGNWQKDRYKAFAASNAGVNIEGKDDDYFATISEYLSIDQYNNAKALERNFSEMYSNKYYWNWTNNDRKAYRGMWVSSEQSYNNLRFIAGALILNRIISAINAVRLVSAYNKNIESETSWNISVGIENASRVNIPSTLTFSFQTSFSL